MIKLDISNRLESLDDLVFKKAFLELKDSFLYAEKNFKNTSIYWLYKQETEKYQERFDKLSSQPAQSNTS